MIEQLLVYIYWTGPARRFIGCGALVERRLCRDLPACTGMTLNGFSPSTADALKSFCDGLGIRERLAQSDPGNAEWQRDLAVSCVKLAEADPSQASAFLTRASVIVQQMQQRGQLAPRDALMPDDLARRIAALPG
jgi:hypothetical protein